MRRISTVVVVGACLALGVGLTGCGSSGGNSSGGSTGSTGSAGDADATGGDTGGATGGGTTGTGEGTTGNTTTGGDTGGNTGATTGTGDTGGGTDTCQPFCQAGWECGPDGCGGFCGDGCAADFVCNNAKHICEKVEVVVPGAAFGAACGRKGDCQPSLADGSDNPQWPACNNAQCDSAICNEPACTKNCTITQDQVDHAGNPGPDGIDDPDAAFNDCAGAEDGPWGNTYTCVALLDPSQGQAVNWCLAGTTFKPCDTSADCPADESCQLQYILGQYSARCTAGPKAGADIGEYCNRNPEIGDVKYCDTTLCFGVGCSGFCKEDADCGANGAFECKKDFDLFGDPQAPTFDICLGKGCTTNAGCPGDSYCAISGNGEQGEAIDWAHICAAAAPGAAKLGEDCEDDPTDNIPKPECAGTCLNNGTCSALCDSDADCATASGNMLCSTITQGIDFDDDGTDDKNLPLGLCFDYSGSNTDCAKDADCAEGEACTFYTFMAGDILDGKGICVTSEAGQGDIGDACGGNSGVTCKSGFCMSSQGDQPGYCSAMCAGQADCPKNATLGLFPGTYNMACRSLLYSGGIDIKDVEQNLYIPLCLPFMAEDSSLQDCTADKTSCPDGQACLAMPIAAGNAAATMEWLCVGTGGTTADGNPIPATGKLGDACDITFADDNGVYCESSLCLQDATADTGYCGAYCEADADCGGGEMICDTVIALDQPGTEGDAITKICRKKTACIPCSTDNECTGDFVCVNVGGAGLLEDRRCAPPCATDAECANAGGGDTCVESQDKNGKAEGINSCAPTSCK